MDKVFIIGNGPSATSKKLGSKIDAADVVVRLNDFKTVGFEEFVGSKTTILFTCRLNEYIYNLSQFQEVIICLLLNPLDGVTIPDELLKSPNISQKIEWPQIHKLNSVVLALREGCYPSTGMICVMEMIQRFGHVNVIGFDNFKNGNGHYYDKGHGVPIWHDGAGEAALLRLFNYMGFLTFGAGGPVKNHTHDNGRAGPGGQNRQGIGRPQLYQRI